MKSLAAVCAALLILPFLLGYIHAGARKGFQAVVVYYRYFAFINVIFSACFVAARMFMVGPEAAAISGWAYSPVFHLYGIALGSVALMGLLTLFKNERIMVAPAICWSIFLIISSAVHAYQIYMHTIKHADIIFVHIIYNVIVTLVLWRFMSAVNRYYLMPG